MPGLPPIVTDVCALVLLGICAWWDLRYRKNPNWATLPGIVLGLGMNGSVSRLDRGSGPRASAFSSASGRLLVLFVLSWMGGGDVKLMAAVGRAEGLSVRAFGAVLLADCGRRHRRRHADLEPQTLRTFKNLFFVAASRVTPLVPKHDWTAEKTQKIPFGLAIVHRDALGDGHGLRMESLRVHRLLTLVRGHDRDHCPGTRSRIERRIRVMSPDYAAWPRTPAGRHCWRP